MRPFPRPEVGKLAPYGGEMASGYRYMHRGFTPVLETSFLELALGAQVCSTYKNTATCAEVRL